MQAHAFTTVCCSQSISRWLLTPLQPRHIYTVQPCINPTKLGDTHKPSAKGYSVIWRLPPGILKFPRLNIEGTKGGSTVAATVWGDQGPLIVGIHLQNDSSILIDLLVPVYIQHGVQIQSCRTYHWLYPRSQIYALFINYWPAEVSAIRLVVYSPYSDMYTSREVHSTNPSAVLDCLVMMNQFHKELTMVFLASLAWRCCKWGGMQ